MEERKNWSVNHKEPGKTEGNFYVGFMMGLTLGAFLLIVGLGMMRAHMEFEGDIVKHQCAHFDERTDEFVWDKEVK